MHSKRAEFHRGLLVFLGGGLGAACRQLLFMLFGSWDRPFPLIVLAINLVGALLLGIVYVLSDEFGLLQVYTRLFVGVGVLGGFTTFSTLAWGTDQLVARSPALALLYVCVSVVGGAVAAAMGIAGGRMFVNALRLAASTVLRRLDDGASERIPQGDSLDPIDLEDREETA